MKTDVQVIEINIGKQWKRIKEEIETTSKILILVWIWSVGGSSIG